MYLSNRTSLVEYNSKGLNKIKRYHYVGVTRQEMRYILWAISYTNLWVFLLSNKVLPKREEQNLSNGMAHTEEN